MSLNEMQALRGNIAGFWSSIKENILSLNLEGNQFGLEKQPDRIITLLQALHKKLRALDLGYNLFSRHPADFLIRILRELPPLLDILVLDGNELHKVENLALVLKAVPTSVNHLSLQKNGFMVQEPQAERETKLNQFLSDLKSLPPNIIQLNLSDNGFTSKDMLKIRAALPKTVRHVFFEQGSLEANVKYTYLNLRNNNLAQESQASLKSLLAIFSSDVENLSLADNQLGKMTKECAKTLFEYPFNRLKTLELQNNGLIEQQHLAPYLVNICKNLQSLDLSGNQLGEHGFLFTGIIARLQRLTHLNLSNNGLGYIRDSNELKYGLPFSLPHNLIFLDLSRNNLDRVPDLDLIFAEITAPLIELNLAGNHLARQTNEISETTETGNPDSDIVDKLIKIIRAIPGTVQKLNLSSNGLEELSVQDLIRILSSLPGNIIELNLGKEIFVEEKLLIILASLPPSVKIVVLDKAYNPIAEIADFCLRCLKTNLEILEFNLKGLSLHSELRKAIITGDWPYDQSLQSLLKALLLTGRVGNDNSEFNTLPADKIEERHIDMAVDFLLKAAANPALRPYAEQELWRLKGAYSYHSVKQLNLPAKYRRENAEAPVIFAPHNPDSPRKDRYLSLISQNLSQESASKLQTRLDDLPSEVEQLYLGNTSLGDLSDECAQILFNRPFNKLEGLELCNNDLYKQQNLPHYLRTIGNTLKYLNLAENQLGRSPCFTDVIANLNKDLLHLNLSGNQLGALKPEVLVNSLVRHMPPHLEYLDLSDNQLALIPFDKLIYLISRLPRSITRINLCYNNFSQEARMAIVASLPPGIDIIADPPPEPSHEAARDTANYCMERLKISINNAVKHCDDWNTDYRSQQGIEYRLKIFYSVLPKILPDISLNKELRQAIIWQDLPYAPSYQWLFKALVLTGKIGNNGPEYKARMSPEEGEEQRIHMAIDYLIKAAGNAYLKAITDQELWQIKDAFADKYPSVQRKLERLHLPARFNNQKPEEHQTSMRHYIDEHRFFSQYAATADCAMPPIQLVL
ncbi:hypothetical protein ACFORL_07380 [Legionella dresdenensis]|uniref:Uncharacterized protein n=1 Tax=Legionella dresdenensis TaxID=450200 RepID=A0ABV8CFC8_9GAMM